MSYKYTKDHILQKPELYPKRHYETEKDFTVKITLPQSEEDRLKEKHPLLPVLQRLLNLKSLSGLLPEPEMKIVNSVNDAYTLLTKSIIYDSIINPVTEEYLDSHNSDVYELPNVEDSYSSGELETEVPLFPDDPGYEIVTQKQESLYSLSNKRFMSDYEDITKDYASSMEQIIHRFFQTMLALADDAEVPDYSYLMEDFDGNAVGILDDDLQHSRDYCYKLQRNREADTRLMQKEFTAENTMIRGRALISAQKQRERYLKENYKINTSALCTTFGNNALFESREMAQKQYENSMYNLYKYLNSSTEIMSDILDKRINEAAVKGQLALNGVNIFQKTPEPIPTATSLDDNKTSNVEDSISSAIDDNAKETPEESAGGSYGYSSVQDCGENAKTAWNFFKKQGFSDSGVAGIMGNFKCESHFDPSIVEGGSHSDTPTDGRGFGLAQWTFASRQQPLVALAQQQGKKASDLGVQLNYVMQELHGAYSKLLPLLQQERDVIDQVVSFHNIYEGSNDTADAVRNNRGAAGIEIYNQFKGTK